MKTSKHDWANLPQLAIKKITKHLLKIEQFNGPRNIQANLSVNFNWHQAAKDALARENIEDKMKIIGMNESARISFLIHLKESEKRLKNLKHLEIEHTLDGSITESIIQVLVGYESRLIIISKIFRLDPTWVQRTTFAVLYIIWRSKNFN